MPKKTTTKKAVSKKAAAKKPAVKKSTTKKTVAKKQATIDSKKVENMYFWGGLLIALCAAGAFMVLAFGIGSMIR